MLKNTYTPRSTFTVFARVLQRDARRHASVDVAAAGAVAGGCQTRNELQFTMCFTTVLCYTASYCGGGGGGVTRICCGVQFISERARYSAVLCFPTQRDCIIFHARHQRYRMSVYRTLVYVRMCRDTRSLTDRSPSAQGTTTVMSVALSHGGHCQRVGVARASRV